MSDKLVRELNSRAFGIRPKNALPCETLLFRPLISQLRIFSPEIRSEAGQTVEALAS
eukprot:jgi/Botrbrau1/21273/Bobra.39_2s0062.1